MPWMKAESSLQLIVRQPLVNIDNAVV